ncbi:MAG: response regulator, partial [Candidatus Aenigmatarchaeota archaeon]
MERILIVDDETNIRYLISEYLKKAGYNTIEASDAEEALAAIRNTELQLVISDIRMPGKDGLWLLKKIKELNEDLSVIMLTALDDTKVAVDCLKMGAYDYLVKPFNPEELQISVKLALERRRLIIENREYQKYLEEKVRQRTAELESAYQLTLMSLVNALDAKEENTGNHSWRVAFYAEAVALKMCIEQKEIADIWRGSLLHDLGKIAIPIEILEKPDKLTEGEFNLMKYHVYYTHRILENISGLEQINAWGSFHHERLDGSGYPFGLKSESLSLGSRIMQIADVFTALIEDRPYRKGLDVNETIEIIKFLVKNNKLDKNVFSIL